MRLGDIGDRKWNQYNVPPEPHILRRAGTGTIGNLAPDAFERRNHLIPFNDSRINKESRSGTSESHGVLWETFGEGGAGPSIPGVRGISMGAIAGKLP